MQHVVGISDNLELSLNLVVFHKLLLLDRVLWGFGSHDILAAANFQFLDVDIHVGREVYCACAGVQVLFWILFDLLARMRGI